MADDAPATPRAAGWRVPAPAPADRVRWPATFGRRFALFVDAEEEFDWSAPFSRAARSVTAIAALPAAHRRFAARGIGVTYLADWPVATDPAAIDILRELLSDGRSAIGAQLHPWVNPPHEEPLSAAASFIGNLPLALQAAKLDRLTDAIATTFGRHPRAFRAGRYGISPPLLGLLAARGYRLDTSMRAYHDYRVDGGPDFGAIGADSFRTGPDGALIELPLTTIHTGALRRLGTRLHRPLGAVPRGRGLAAHARILSRVPLTPEGVPVAEALEAVRVALGEGVALLNLAFHSPSLVPGHTPYVRDTGDLARFHAWWDAMLDLLDREGVRPATLDEVLAAAR